MLCLEYPTAEQLWSALRRPAQPSRPDVVASVRDILAAVRTRGDRALQELTRSFDGADLDTVVLPDHAVTAAAANVPASLRKAIDLAASNIRTFHTAQQESFPPMETMPGVTCWRKSVPIDRVGLYVPGGSAPLFSTVLMLGIPAAIAGCRDVVLCTPPSPEGAVHPAICYAAKVAGIHRVFRVGGAQAVAAMAYGTDSVPQVDKILGPGNRFVTTAKLLVQAEGVAIDMPAGPSEVMVYADDSCIPAFVAADLLAQAEHDADSQTVLLTTSRPILRAVHAAVCEQVASLPRQAALAGALARSAAICLPDRFAVLDTINRYAPEHLILACDQAASLAEQVRNAGSVFLGNFSPEAAGDYASGTNHTLPTSGFSRSFSGVSLDSFLKKITFQEISREGLRALGPHVVTMALAEELPAHARSVSLRLDWPGSDANP
jgi:histidinol dehydrogenase